MAEFNKPTVGQDSNNWGVKLNNTLQYLKDRQDAQAASVDGVSGAAAQAANDASTALLAANAAASAASAAESSAAVASASATTAAGLSSRTGAKAVGQGEIHRNVLDYGAVGNNSHDDTAAIQAAIDAAGNGGTVFLPAGNYVVSSTLVVPTGTSLVGAGKPSLSRIRFTLSSEAYGITYDDGDLGASKYDTVTVSNLQFAGTAKAFLFLSGAALFRVERIIALSVTVPVLRIENSQDFNVRDIDVLTGGLTDDAGEGAVIYLSGCNNVYLERVRVESPRGAAISAVNSSGIFWTSGKVDGNASAGSTVAPFLKLTSSWARISNVHMDGAVYFPVELAGPGSWVEFTDCHFQNNGADAIVKVTSQNAFRDLADYLPGALQTPWVSFRHCRIVAESRNQSNRDTKALVYSDGVEPTYSPNGETFPMTASGGGLVSGYVQRTMKWGPSADLLPPRNDQYVGAWLTHMQTGLKKRVFYNLSNGQTRVDHPTLADFPTGAFYRLEFTGTDGVRVDVTDVTVMYRLRRDSFHVTTAVVTGLTVSAGSYSSFQSTIPVTGGTPDSSWVGKYLTRVSDGAQWLIRGFSGGNVILDYDVVAAVTAGAYEVRAGRGNDSLLRWYD